MLIVKLEVCLNLAKYKSIKLYTINKQYVPRKYFYLENTHSHSYTQRISDQVV